MAAAAYTPSGSGMPSAPGAPVAPGGFGPPPAVSRRGRGALVAHLVWEAVLAVAMLVVLGLAAASDGDLVRRALLPQAGIFLLVAAAMSISLWSGAPNLAVGGIAVLTVQLGAWLIDSQGWSLWPAMLAAAVVSVPIGLVMGVLAGPLGLPGWAVTLATAGMLEAVGFAVNDARSVTLPFTSDLRWLWLGLGLATAVATSAITWVPGIRGLAPGTGAGPSGLLAPRRPPLDDRHPGAVPSPVAGVAPLVALLLSSVLAGVAGVAQASRVQAALPQGGFFLTTTGLAVALLGGASAHGRRLGLFGTALAGIILAGVATVMLYRQFEGWTQGLAFAVATLVGLLAGGVLDRVGRN